MNFKRSHFAALVIAVAIVPTGAATASAATKHSKTKHAKTTKSKTVTAKRVAAKAKVAAPTATPAPTPAPAPAAPTFTSVISIGGYVFYNLTYAEAVDAWFAAVAAAPAGYTPPPVYSVSVNTTVSGSVEDGN